MARLRVALRRGTLSAAVDADDVVLDSAEFTDLPVVEAPDVLVLILDPGGAGECVYVTAHTEASTSVTVTRGMETDEGHGIAASHDDGTAWQHDPTPKDYHGLTGHSNFDASGASPSVDLSGLKTFSAHLVGDTPLAGITVSDLPPVADTGSWHLAVSPEAPGAVLTLPGTVDDRRVVPDAPAGHFDLLMLPAEDHWIAFDLTEPPGAVVVDPDLPGGGFAIYRTVVLAGVAHCSKIPDQGSPISVVLQIPDCTKVWRLPIAIEAQDTPDTVSAVLFSDDGVGSVTAHWITTAPADDDFVTGLAFTAYSLGDGDLYLFRG